MFEVSNTQRQDCYVFRCYLLFLHQISMMVPHIDDKLEIATAEPQYLFDNVQFIWSVVKQGVESIALCEEQTK